MLVCVNSDMFTTLCFVLNCRSCNCGTAYCFFAICIASNLYVSVYNATHSIFKNIIIHAKVRDIAMPDKVVILHLNAK